MDVVVLAAGEGMLLGLPTEDRPPGRLVRPTDRGEVAGAVDGDSVPGTGTAAGSGTE